MVSERLKAMGKPQTALKTSLVNVFDSVGSSLILETFPTFTSEYIYGIDTTYNIYNSFTVLLQSRLNNSTIT